MESQIRTFSYPNGEIQRVQVFRWEDWAALDFLHLPGSGKALDCFSDIYRQYLVPSCPWLFGNILMFRIPEGLDAEFPFDTCRYGTVADRLTAAAAALRDGVWFLNGKPVFRNAQAKRFYRGLEQRGSLRIIRGKLPITTVIPLGDAPGYLTETEPDAAMKVNASFFIMDPFDCATVYDHIGTPFGLQVKDGIVASPPLFGREALLVKQDGSVSITYPQLEELVLQINGVSYVPGKNATIYSRPERRRTPRRTGKALVIIGCRIAAIAEGSVPIPASGFVLCPDSPCSAQAGDAVVYRGMEDVVFGIQVGNSILKDGVKTECFLSRFYNLRRLEPIPYPPSLYPMDFHGARAARMALGSDKAGKPVLLWAEGAGKLHYAPGEDSCGASLSEMAELCSKVGMVNAVNLDGGGSAQILLRNRRSLLISDRKKADNTEAERPVPLGLILR